MALVKIGAGSLLASVTGCFTAALAGAHRRAFGRAANLLLRDFLAWLLGGELRRTLLLGWRLKRASLGQRRTIDMDIVIRVS